MSAESYDCAECGMRTRSAREYHPFLFCELWKLGHRDPAAYLASYGFTRAAPPETKPPATESDPT